MAGTIYEWCINLFNDPLDITHTSINQGRRSLRGGSWYTNIDYARCKHRDGEFPGDRRDGIGFRIICTNLNV